MFSSEIHDPVVETHGLMISRCVFPPRNAVMVNLYVTYLANGNTTCVDGSAMVASLDVHRSPSSHNMRRKPVVPVVQEDLRKDVAHFSRTLEDLTHGNNGRGVLPAPDGTVQVDLQKVKDVWAVSWSRWHQKRLDPSEPSGWRNW